MLPKIHLFILILFIQLLVMDSSERQQNFLKNETQEQKRQRLDIRNVFALWQKLTRACTCLPTYLCVYVPTYRIYFLYKSLAQTNAPNVTHPIVTVYVFVLVVWTDDNSD
jgi:hypothetical protein